MWFVCRPQTSAFPSEPECTPLIRRCLSRFTSKSFIPFRKEHKNTRIKVNICIPKHFNTACVWKYLRYVSFHLRNLNNSLVLQQINCFTLEASVTGFYGHQWEFESYLLLGKFNLTENHTPSLLFISNLCRKVGTNIIWG